MYTREQWAKAFIKYTGNQNPDTRIIQWVINWTVFESSAGRGASFNLLNTIQHAEGSTRFNSADVQNFVSFYQGTFTNALVLHNGRYPHIFQAISKNVYSMLQDINNVNRELIVWGTGAHAQDLLNMFGRTQDEFPGDVTSPPVLPNPVQAGNTYVVMSGDTLTSIARGKPMSERALLALNKALLDNAAQNHGHTDSNNGNLIFPGTVIDL